MSKQLFPTPEHSFRASWISLSEEPVRPNVTFRARKRFDVGEAPASAPLFVTAESQYVLWVNDVKMGFGPARGTRTVNYYDAFEIAPYLRPHQPNIITVLVHADITSTFVDDSDHGGLLLECAALGVATDESWEIQEAADFIREGDLVFNVQNGYSESRDFTAPEKPWGKAAPVPPKSRMHRKALEARPVPPLRKVRLSARAIASQQEFVPNAPVKLTEWAQLLNDEVYHPLPQERLPQGAALLNFGGNCMLLPSSSAPGAALVFDFGRDSVGRVEFPVDAEEDGVICDLVYGEELWSEHPERLRASYDANPTYHFTDHFILKQGSNRLGTMLKERGFRFIMAVFRNFRKPLRLHAPLGHAGEYPYAERAAFHCSDPLLNDIWKMCVLTLQVCTTDVFMDCPWRERSFWVNDLVVENHTTLNAFGASAVHAHAFDLAFSQQTPDTGLVPGVCPAPLDAKDDPDPWLILLPTQLFLFLMLKDYLLYSGDLETVRRQLPHLQRIIETFRSFIDTQDGLLQPPQKYWNFYDWTYELDGYSFSGCKESMLNHLLLMALPIYESLREACGTPLPPEEHSEWQAIAKRMRAAIRTTFRDPATGRLVDNIQHAEGKEIRNLKITSQLPHAIALVSGCDNPKEASVDEAAMLDGSLKMPELYLHYFVFQAMALRGEKALADGLARIRKYWGKVVLTGYPTLFETAIRVFGRKSFGDGGSLCHGFGTGPIMFLQQFILGVTPSEPGFRTFQFQPRLLGLDEAAGEIPTPCGNILVKLDKQGIALTVPQGITAIYHGECLEAGAHRLSWK